MTIRISFALDPLAAIPPWTHADGTPFLSWFALTRGEYEIELGAMRLFEYAPDFRAATGAPRRVAYQVVRLLEDLLDLAPAVFTRAPPAVEAFLRDRPREGLVATVTDAPRGGTAEDAARTRDWLASRTLSVDHLAGAPRVLVLLAGEHVVTEWTATAARDGVRLWSAPEFGRMSAPLDVFVDAIEDFHRELMQAMAARIADVAAGARGDVAIDVAGLARDQRAWERAMRDFKESAVLRDPDPEDAAAFAAILGT